MTDREFHDLIAEAIAAARDHIEKHWVHRDHACIAPLMDKIETEIRFREFESYQRSIPQLPGNPFGC